MSRIDPWSVMKTAFLLSIAFGIVTWVAVFIIWSAMAPPGCSTTSTAPSTEVLGTPTAEVPDRELHQHRQGDGLHHVAGCADVLIITALATLGSFLYNIAATCSAASKSRWHRRTDIARSGLG